MACILTDAHRYNNGEKRPKIPKEPMCVPVKLHKKQVRKWSVLLVLLIAAPIAFVFYLSGIENETERSDKTALFGAVSAAVFTCAMVGLQENQEKVYAKLRNPMRNPQGYTYQGRVLSPADPHYQLHLHYYNMNGTWELPDEVERSGFMGQGGFSGFGANGAGSFFGG
ncbi:hypothetical protein IJT93_00875 [bacterium]|nr:hypothetical protein [bacterium]